MKNTALLLTNSKDAEHTDSVLKHLSDLKAKAFRLDADRLSRGEQKLRFAFDSSSFGFEISDACGQLHSSEISSIWYRRPNEFDFEIKDDRQRDFAALELKSILEGLWATLSDRVWLSDPHSLTRARKKILQWKLAREVGFLLPDTIITNDPERVVSFYESHGREIVVKSLEQAYLEYPTAAYNMPTTLLPQSALKNLSLIAKLPVLFQAHVRKAYELRVTVVGKEVFPVRIDSQEFPETRIDWRHPQFIHRLKHGLVELPCEIEAKCLELLRRLGLAFGAFDIVVTPDGEYVFLEVNPNGQWYWMEHLIGVPISHSIAKYLVVKP